MKPSDLVPTPKLSTSECFTLIDDCEARESRLSSWEANFISSIRSQLEDDYTLTDRQCGLLESVWEEATKDG